MILSKGDKMKVIGLTGGIASGKSTVSNIIKKLGGLVIDADIIAREIVESGKPVLQKIVDSFGQSVLKEDGTLNRKYLGSIVFNNKEKLKKLNNITHPAIKEKINDTIKYFECIGKNLVFLDAALLIEMEMYKKVDEVWLIVVDRETQVKRLMNRDNISYQDAIKRIESQMPLEEKTKYADVIINNQGSIEELENKVILEYKRALEVHD